ncbi:hypothetical protein RJ55_06109 [Drechmeria coniospora]|nr:hypothetical protein RJ55_06109 [Drechmeria coniospora]
MQINALLFALLGFGVLADAASTERRSPFSRVLNRRQNNNRQGGQGRNNGGQGRNNGGQGRNNGGQGRNNNGGQGRNNNGGQGRNNNGGNNNGGRNALILNQNLVQTASQDDGNNPGADGQAASATNNANFINFCQSAGTLTNGQQIRQGSCNSIPMGRIPAANRMVTSVFVNPQNGDTLVTNQDFKIQVQVNNLDAGAFTNATSTYYSAPQDLNTNGVIIGHTHVTCQDMGASQNPTTPPNPTEFKFFKGINDDGNGRGLLSADVNGGLPAGNYRCCSMSSAANHQPVLMPVAQRGAQDDCVRFSVRGRGNGNNRNNNQGRQGGNNQGQGNGNNRNNNNQGRQGGNNQRQGNARIVDNQGIQGGGNRRQGNGNVGTNNIQGGQRGNNQGGQGGANRQQGNGNVGNNNQGTQRAGNQQQGKASVGNNQGIQRAGNQQQGNAVFGNNPALQRAGNQQQGNVALGNNLRGGGQQQGNGVVGNNPALQTAGNQQQGNVALGNNLRGGGQQQGNGVVGNNPALQGGANQQRGNGNGKGDNAESPVQAPWRAITAPLFKMHVSPHQPVLFGNVQIPNRINQANRCHLRGLIEVPFPQAVGRDQRVKIA